MQEAFCAHSNYENLCIQVHLILIYFYFEFKICSPLLSIMGEGVRLGIVPQFAKELFDRVEGTTDNEVIDRDPELQ